MKIKELQKKYAEYKKKLHTCSPLEYEATKKIMNYYYGRLIAAGGKA